MSRLLKFSPDHDIIDTQYCTAYITSLKCIKYVERATRMLPLLGKTLVLLSMPSNVAPV